MACIVVLARPITGAILNYRWLSLTITASRMAKTFKRGDHVEWNSEAGRVRGVILKAVVSDVRFKGYVHHATKEEPQYFIKAIKPTISQFTKARPLDFSGPKTRRRNQRNGEQGVVESRIRLASPCSSRFGNRSRWSQQEGMA